MCPEPGHGHHPPWGRGAPAGRSMHHPLYTASSGGKSFPATPHHCLTEALARGFWPWLLPRDIVQKPSLLYQGCSLLTHRSVSVPGTVTQNFLQVVHFFLLLFPSPLFCCPHLHPSYTFTLAWQHFPSLGTQHLSLRLLLGLTPAASHQLPTRSAARPVLSPKDVLPIPGTF